MNNTEVKDILIAAAQGKKICEPGYERMLTCDIDGLVDYYLEMPDWCMERDFPNFATLKEHFSDCEDKGVFVGKTFHGELLNERQVYIFHHCKGKIRVGLNVEKAIIPMLYLGNKCRLHIVGVGDSALKNPTIVPLYTFGKNDVSAHNNKFVKFTLNNTDLI